MEDEKIVELFELRNETAIEEISNKYGKKLKHLASNILRSEEDALECVNDAYMKTWNRIPPDKPKHLYAFLATITRRLALDRLDWENAKKRQAEVVELTKELEECIGDNKSYEIQDDQDLSALLSTFVESLEEKKRVIFIRRYWYSDSIKDISRRMMMSEVAIKVALHRTRKDLKVFLIKEGYFHE